MYREEKNSQQSKLPIKKTSSTADWLAALRPTLAIARDYEPGRRNKNESSEKVLKWEVEPESTELVRFSDCDPFGHLNNAKYIEYFVNARDLHLKNAYQVDLAVHALKLNEAWVVKEHRISYLRPARLKEHLVIRSRLLNYSENETFVESMMLNSEGRHLKALLWSKYSYINLKSGRSTRHPDWILDILKATRIDYSIDLHGGFDGRSKAVMDELRLKDLRKKANSKAN